MTHRLTHRRLVGSVVLLAGLTACADVSPSGCPITDPGEMALEAPTGYPADPSEPDSVWFGTDELWTALPADGTYAPRKSVWWSVDFQGSELEPRPELTVSYERLNSHAEPVVFAAPGTNAFTEADGDFMANGLDQAVPGCWRVTAEYRDASLSYTYEVGGG